MKFDYVVLGGGIGGYPGAIELARNGFKVGLVTDSFIGGECTNFGCIPTKMMIKATASCKRKYQSEDWMKIVSLTKKVVEESRVGLEKVLAAYGVRIINGKGIITGGSISKGFSIRVNKQEILAGKILLATGSSPTYPPGLKKSKRLLDNRKILELNYLPKTILILGAGPVGVEYAKIFSCLGVRVILVELMSNVLPGFPRDLSRQVKIGMEELGVEIHTSTTIDNVEDVEGGVKYKLSSGHEGVVDYILVATGRKPNTANLGLEELGVELDDKGFVKVDNRMETSVEGVFAAGDVTGPPLLAHKAFYQSLVAAENMMGRESYFSYQIPIMVFSYPEVAYIGMSWSEAKAKGLNVARKRIPLSVHTRSHIEGWEKGFARVVYEKDTGRVLGFEMAGPMASELVGLASLLINNNLDIGVLDRSMMPHPTMIEIFRELVEAVKGKPIHYYQKV